MPITRRLSFLPPVGGHSGHLSIFSSHYDDFGPSPGLMPSWLAAFGD
jgi:hypothetical protein